MSAAPDLDFSDLGPTLPAPDDIETSEGFLKSFDDTDLFWQSWESDSAKGSVALMHGFGEHSSRYHHVASALVRAGYNVMAIDARGHGRSNGVRGHVNVYDDYARDLDRLVGEVQARWALPVFVFGHSNGGLIAMRHALMHDDRVLAYAVSSPFLGFQVKVPAAKAIAGNLMSKVWPTFSMPTDIPASVVSHLEEVVTKYDKDPLNTGVATARWFTEAKAAQADLLERAKEITQPFFFLVAGADELADPRAAEEVYHRLGSHEREFEILPELFHEVLNEAEWEELMTQMVTWLNKNLPG